MVLYYHYTAPPLSQLLINSRWCLIVFSFFKRTNRKHEFIIIIIILIFLFLYLYIYYIKLMIHNVFLLFPFLPYRSGSANGGRGEGFEKGRSFKAAKIPYFKPILKFLYILTHQRFPPYTFPISTPPPILTILPFL